MKINILSAGRFHVLDLARELDRQGFDVKFYSFVPRRRAAFFGLPECCSSSLVIPLAPFLLLEKKLFPRKRWANQLRIWIQDRLTSVVMRRCDVLIAMSGDYIVSLRVAKRHGSKIILERGSKHILEQKRMLESIPSLKGTDPVPIANVKRELAGYRIADVISVGSQHVKRSFIKYGVSADILFVNPYGVDLSMFRPLPVKVKKYDVISVGAWSFRKGSDLTIEAIRKLGVNFLHVGGILDVPFPEEDNFTHIDKVDQSQLIEYYNQAKVFLLPSREEGLAMVQVQAIACNLPIIGSPNSGALDLKEMVARPECVFIIEDYTVESIVKCIKNALTIQNLLRDEIYAGDALKNLTWTAYGHRYADFLHTYWPE